MGLGIVRQIVAMHSGRLAAELRPEGGSLLSVALADQSDPSTAPRSGAHLLELYGSAGIHVSGLPTHDMR